MKSTRAVIDLASLIGAEETVLNGQRGIFIPYVPNCKIVQTKRRALILSSFEYYPAPALKSYDMKGRLIIPQEHLDRCISDPRLIRKRNTVSWLWNGTNSGESVVSRNDFTSIAGLSDE